jgi:hypothetical protein
VERKCAVGTLTQTLLVHTIPTTHSALLTLTTTAPQLPPPSPPRSTLKRVHFTHDTTLDNSNTTPTHAPPTLLTPANAIEARARQLQRMTAERPPRAAPLPWPLPSPSARALFDTRHPTAQMRSAGYAATQLRMLWLADIPPDDRFAAFEKECFLRQLAPTTAATYWVRMALMPGIRARSPEHRRQGDSAPAGGPCHGLPRRLPGPHVRGAPEPHGGFVTARNSTRRLYVRWSPWRRCQLASCATGLSGPRAGCCGRAL